MLKGTRTLLVVCAAVLAVGPLEAQRRPITAAEIEKAGVSVTTAFEAVTLLRPRWLQAPLETTQQPGSWSDPRMGQVRVYQDEVDMGSVDYLKSIRAEYVATLRWMSANEAGSRFGPSLGPVIVVTLKPVNRD